MANPAIAPATPAAQYRDAAGMQYLQKSTDQFKRDVLPKLIELDPDQAQLLTLLTFGPLKSAPDVTEHLIILNSVRSESEADPTPLGYSQDSVYNYLNETSLATGATLRMQNTDLYAGWNYSMEQKQIANAFREQMDRALLFSDLDRALLFSDLDQITAQIEALKQHQMMQYQPIFRACREQMALSGNLPLSDDEQQGGGAQAAPGGGMTTLPGPGLAPGAPMRPSVSRPAFGPSQDYDRMFDQRGQQR